MSRRPCSSVRVYGAGRAMAEVAETLAGLGARHPTWADAGDGSGRGLVAVELHPDAADRALERSERDDLQDRPIWATTGGRRAVSLAA